MVMQALIFVFNSDMIYPMESMDENKKRIGRPSHWEDTLGKVVQSGTQFPKDVWVLLRERETKILNNEMVLSEEFKKKIHRLGAEQNAKRLSAENEKTPPE